MDKIKLNRVPNQEHTCQLGGKLFDITVQLGKSGGTLLTVAVNGKQVITSRLAAAQVAMIPAPDNIQYGNMGWICEDGASYPDYKKFGITHHLYWWKD